MKFVKFKFNRDEVQWGIDALPTPDPTVMAAGSSETIYALALGETALDEEGLGEISVKAQFLGFPEKSGVVIMQ